MLESFLEKVTTHLRAHPRRPPTRLGKLRVLLRPVVTLPALWEFRHGTWYDPHNGQKQVSGGVRMPPHLAASVYYVESGSDGESDLESVPQYSSFAVWWKGREKLLTAHLFQQIARNVMPSVERCLMGARFLSQPDGPRYNTHHASHLLPLQLLRLIFYTLKWALRLLLLASPFSVWVECLLLDGDVEANLGPLVRSFFCYQQGHRECCRPGPGGGEIAFLQPQVHQATPL